MHLDSGHNSNIKPVKVSKLFISFGFEEWTGAEFLRTLEGKSVDMHFLLR